MCSQLGVAGGINTQSLNKEIERRLDEREHQRREQLIAALPNESRAAVKEIGSMVETAVILHLGQELECLRTIAGERAAAQNVDLGKQRAHIRDLLSKIDHLEAEIADLGRSKCEREERLTRAQAENAALKSRISDLEKEQDFRSQMLAVMKETLEQKAEAAV
jgi:BMFP domain-containing protein YqiC